MKHVMAVYDVDPLYAVRFAEVVNQKEKIPFEVMAFRSMERLKNFAKENPIELLLISSLVGREEIEELGIKRVISLADGETLKTDMEYPSIYKYQSSDNIIREVMSCYCEVEGEARPVSLSSPAAIIGVYSPVGRCLKTSFALTIGQLLAQDERALYVTLEEYSGFSTLAHTEYQSDLSDLMYYYNQGNYNILRLNSVIHSLNGLDYVPPARYPEDLAQMGAEQMADLIRKIAEESIYETVILDVGNYGRQVFPLLKICSVIYMPVKEDSVSLAKIEEFYNHLNSSGNEAIREKIKNLKLPYHSSFGRRENYLEQLLWGELGDYVRQLLKGGVRR
ncbi:MAG: hypothetical protein RSE05_05780 [Clostridium sp.]